MELSEFAERVLFARTLEEKLERPDSITDESPGSPAVIPAAPGRPADLHFKTISDKAAFPGFHQLDHCEERGRLLHFFANHELLATELMALALLRFPEAPPAFRRGLLQTLRDEQLHTRLYIKRMNDCGIQFGDLPVSGYFWRAVSSMENPIDYVASLSLTFEQANLDFCRQFGDAFEAIGDAPTARLLKRVYRDEIGHVAYGLKWFRRWKNPDQSDWDAFCGQLKFPLSPNRAKGPLLNVEGRRAAGFDAAFIAELDVYSQSKGRTPNVFVFNPFAEGRIARGRSFTPVKHQQLLARDLENLPQFLCRQDDVVLVSKRPGVQFLSAIKKAGFPIPEFVEVKAGRIAPGSSLLSRKLGELRPWAWGPDSVELLEPLLTRATGVARQNQRFIEKIAQLYSKAWSAGLLRIVLESRPAEDWLCGQGEAGAIAASVEEVLEVVAAIRARGHHRVVVKEAIGLAGHNAIRLWEPQILETQRRWIANAVRGGREVVVEPWLERELDLSVQLEMRSDGLKLCGYTGLINDAKGQYQGNWAEPNYMRRAPAAVTSLFCEPADIGSRVRELYAGIFSRLEKELNEAGYIGPVGIDALVYCKPDGKRCLKPIVEINPRYTMGRLTVELMKRACPGSSGQLRLINRATARAEGFSDLSAYSKDLATRRPLRLEGEPVARIRDGVLCLNDPELAQVCLAVFEVSRAPWNVCRS